MSAGHRRLIGDDRATMNNEQSVSQISTAGWLANEDTLASQL